MERRSDVYCYSFLQTSMFKIPSELRFLDLRPNGHWQLDMYYRYSFQTHLRTVSRSSGWLHFQIVTINLKSHSSSLYVGFLFFSAGVSLCTAYFWMAFQYMAVPIYLWYHSISVRYHLSDYWHMHSCQNSSPPKVGLPLAVEGLFLSVVELRVIKWNFL